MLFEANNKGHIIFTEAQYYSQRFKTIKYFYQRKQ